MLIRPVGKKILLVKAELVDQNTGLPVRGLYTPGSSGDNDGAGAMAANQVHMSAMASLTGEARQRINLPIYAEEDLLTEGRYLLRVVAEDAESQVWASEVPVLVVKKNMRALITLGLGILALVVYLGLLVRRAPGGFGNLENPTADHDCIIRNLCFCRCQRSFHVAE